MAASRDSVGLLVSTILTKGSKNTSQAAWKRHAVFLNVGVCFVRVPLERDALQFELSPHGYSVLTVYVRCNVSDHYNDWLVKSDYPLAKGQIKAAAFLETSQQR